MNENGHGAENVRFSSEGNVQSSKAVLGSALKGPIEWAALGFTGEVINKLVFHNPGIGPSGVALFAVMLGVPSPREIAGSLKQRFLGKDSSDEVRSKGWNRVLGGTALLSLAPLMSHLSNLDSETMAKNIDHTLSIADFVFGSGLTLNGLYAVITGKELPLPLSSSKKK